LNAFGHNPGVNETTAETTEETPAEPGPAPAPQADPAACAARLKERFPALFAGAPKPLKLRIQADIHERAPGEFTKQDLSAFFRRYTTSTSYLIALTKAPNRFDLDGQPAGELSDEHRRGAAEELARRRANRQAREQLEAQQRRNRAGLLYDYERTTLTTANFCVLKGVAVDELDGLLALAREERAAAPPAHVPPHAGRPPRPGGPAPRDARGAPRDGAPRGPGRRGPRGA
jgi:ProP effector